MNGLTPAIIAASVTLLTIAITSKNDKNKMFSDVVTKQRINTINTMRNLVAEVCSLLQSDLQNTKAGQSKSIKLKKDIYKLKMLISIHCEKDGNEAHFALEQLLDKIMKYIENNINTINSIDCNQTICEIIKISRYIFDYEWNRIKREVRDIND